MTQRSTRPFKISWSAVFTILIAILLLMLAFRGVDWNEMLTTVQKGRIEYLILAFFGLTFSYFLRSLRWRVLLGAEKPVNPITVFWGACVGYLGNSFLPARAGEIIRSVLIGQRTGINKLFVFATAITERIFDAALLVTIIIVLLPVLNVIPDWLLSARQAMIVIAVLGFAGLLAAPRLEPLIVRILRAIPIPENLSHKLIDAAQKFILGLRAFQNPVRATSFIGLSALLWSVDVLEALIVAEAFGISLTPQQALFLLAALGLSSAIPSTPGYVGVYQFVAVTVMEPFGIAQSEALVYILAFQAVSYTVVIIWGGIGLWRLNVRPEALTEIGKTDELESSPTPTP